jgi:hypothetical protein
MGLASPQIDLVSRPRATHSETKTMGEVIAFRLSKKSSTRPANAEGPMGEILFFTGVRCEIIGEIPSPSKSPSNPYGKGAGKSSGRG